MKHPYPIEECPMRSVSIMICCAVIILAAVPVTGYCQHVPDEYDMRVYTSPDSVTITHLVYIPKNIEAGHQYPFVIYLHGSCEECVTHERILQESGLQIWHSYSANEQIEPTFLFAPAGGRAGWTSEPRRDAIFEIIDGLIEEFPIDTQRIYIMGFSMGAQGTWNYLQYRPGFFAAANPQAIGGGNVDADLVKDVPIWATIGQLDQANRVAQLKDNVGRIRAANGDNRGPLTNVTGVNPRFTTFPGTEHGGAQGETQRIPGFLHWFYSQVNDGNIPPVVRFTSPEIGQKSIRIQTSSIQVSVSATDTDGEIEKVEFYIDGVLQGSVARVPYNFTFFGLSTGYHALTVTAYDDGMKINTAGCVVKVEGN